MPRPVDALHDGKLIGSQLEKFRVEAHFFEWYIHGQASSFRGLSFFLLGSCGIIPKTNRRNRIQLFLALAMVLLASASWAGEPYQAKVVGISDGDRLQLRHIAPPYSGDDPLSCRGHGSGPNFCQTQLSSPEGIPQFRPFNNRLDVLGDAIPEDVTGWVVLEVGGCGVGSCGASSHDSLLGSDNGFGQKVRLSLSDP